MVGAVTAPAPTLPDAARRPALPLDLVQRLVLWLMVASGFYVVMEPAPYELLFVLALVLFLPNRMQSHVVLAPLVLFLLLYNLGGVAGVVPITYDDKAVWFVVISIYMAVTALFFAFAVTHDPAGLLPLVRHAWTWAAVFAAVLAVAGYFDVAGTQRIWAPLWRAQGAFKDPNVLSTFLIAPTVFLLQDLIMRRTRWRLTAVVALAIIMAAQFLAFSRGAWVNCAMAILLMLGLTFVLNPSVQVRSRIVLALISGALALSAMISFALSFEAVREVFEIRVSLSQSYDVGETGRFGNQLNAVPLLLQMPNGMGPYQFNKWFGEDPHNVYLNAFASYGWLGGISYLLLVVATVGAGWRAVFSTTPWQYHAIAVFPPLFTTILQGIQIDTDHWRHFYLLLGLTWGLYAATVARGRAQAADDSFIRTMPATISEAASTRSASAGSPSATTPTTNAPAAPMPVHTA